MSGNPPKPEWNDDSDNTMGKYILKYRNPVACSSLLKWGKYMQRHHRKKRVRSTYIGTCWVSTVFLWLGHSFESDGEPVLFETMVFSKDGGALDDYTERTTTWRKALKQHWAIVERIKNER